MEPEQKIGGDQSGLELVVGGARGTQTLTGCEFNAYGGDTTCFLVRGTSGREVLVDLGSGVRTFEGRWEIGRETCLPILMTHYHFDHINGLPKFAPLYNPAIELDVTGPALAGFDCEGIFHHFLDQPLWPIPLDSLGPHNQFSTLPTPASFEAVPFHGFHLRWCTMPHFEGCVAYRLDDPESGASLVIATDVEWPAADEAQRADLLRLCRDPHPANLLVFDGHFFPGEYAQFPGWGHGTWEDAVQVAQRGLIDNLLVTHHAPAHPDAALDAASASLDAALPGARFARQGEVVVVAS